jgi:hypothetical protein
VAAEKAASYTSAQPQNKVCYHYDPNTMLFHRAKSRTRLQAPPASDCADRTQNDSDAGRLAFICPELVWTVPLFPPPFEHFFSHANGPIFSVKKTPEEQNELLAKLDAHGSRPASASGRTR